MQVRIWPASLPPPIASNASVAPVSTSALVRSFINVGEVESTTCFAPMLRRMSACSGLRTILTRPTPSLRQILLSICPRLDAAAVCTRALWPSRRMVSTMPSAVSGLTKQEAPSAGVMPAGSGRHSITLRQRYCEYIAPPMMATVLPIRALAASDEPVLTTTPAPSLPTGIDSSSRPAMAFIAPCGTFAVITGKALVPEAFAVDISAAPIRSPISDGLIGVASTRTTTSSSAGSGVGMLASDSSSSPLFLSSERSCSPVLPSLILISSLPAVQHPVADPRFVRPEPLAIWSRSAMMSTCNSDFSQAPAPGDPLKRGTSQPGSRWCVARWQRFPKPCKPVISALSRPHLAPKHQRRRILGCATWLDWAFGGRDLEPAAISNAGNCVLSSRNYRGLGVRQPYLHCLASH